jgi:hypothetical protein
MIVQSGNDASVALAEHIAGTEPTFAEMMNTQAARLGMTNSHFVNTAGLPDPEHYTTPRDIAKVAAAVIREFPDYYAWYSLPDFTFNNIKQSNRNRLLRLDPSVDGVKTGHTAAAGYCLVSSAERDGRRLLAVVMGTGSDRERVADSQALLNYGFSFSETHRPRPGGGGTGHPRHHPGRHPLAPLRHQGHHPAGQRHGQGTRHRGGRRRCHPGTRRTRHGGDRKQPVHRQQRAADHAAGERRDAVRHHPRPGPRTGRRIRHSLCPGHDRSARSGRRRGDLADQFHPRGGSGGRAQRPSGRPRGARPGMAADGRPVPGVQGTTASRRGMPFWLAEHPPVFTQGQAGRAEHLLAPGDIPVVQTDRGGQVTYHGPGSPSPTCWWTCAGCASACACW